MKKFYVIHTKPRQEQKAVLNLERQGFKTWYPKFKKTIIIKNKERITEEPVFQVIYFDYRPFKRRLE